MRIFRKKQEFLLFDQNLCNFPSFSQGFGPFDKISCFLLKVILMPEIVIFVLFESKFGRLVYGLVPSSWVVSKFHAVHLCADQTWVAKPTHAIKLLL